MDGYGDLDVREFLASPRHASEFLSSTNARSVIRDFRDQLVATGKIAGVTPVINIEAERDMVEMHDGDAAAVAWLIYAAESDRGSTLTSFSQSFEAIVVLKGRRDANGEVLHPFVSPDVGSTNRLQSVYDRALGRTVRKALSRSGETVYFDDESYFSGRDATERLGVIADRLARDL